MAAESAAANLGSAGKVTGLYSQVLTPATQKVLHRIGPYLKKRHFYLGGGTALALYFGHRKSKDLDWFRPKLLSDPAEIVRDRMLEKIPFQVQQIDRGNLEGTISGIRVSMFEYRYPLLESVAHWSEAGVDLASRQDLSAMKLSAITERGSKKDFIDVFALARNGMDLSDMLAAYQKKFKIRGIGHVLYALTYFDDADRERTPIMLWRTDWRAVKSFILKWLNDWLLKRANPRP